MTDYLDNLALPLDDSGDYVRKSFKVTEAEDGTLTAELIVTVKPATKTGAALITARENLRAACDRATTYVNYVTGATSPVAYEIVSCQSFVCDEKAEWMANAFWDRVTITFKLKSWPRAARQTVYDTTAVGTPDVLDLSTLLGTVPSELDVLVDDQSGNAMHSVILCLCGREMTADQSVSASARPHWLLGFGASGLLPAASWSGSVSDGTQATSWLHSDCYTTSASWSTVAIDTRMYREGPYKVFARVQQSAGIGYVATSQDIGGAVAVTGATPHLVEVGDVQLPTADALPGTAANLTLYIHSDGTNTLRISGLLILPLDRLVVWHHSDPTSEIDELRVGPSGVFMDGVCDKTYLVPDHPLVPEVLAVHCPNLVSDASPSGSTWPASWYRSSTGSVTASSSRVKMVGGASALEASPSLSAAGAPTIAGGELVEFAFTRDVDSRTSGSTSVTAVWCDIDGNVVDTTVLATYAADTASEALVFYAKAPRAAERVYLKFTVTAGASLTVYYSGVYVRQPIPQQLVVVAEDSTGTLDGSYKHAVNVSVWQPAQQAVAR